MFSGNDSRAPVVGYTHVGPVGHVEPGPAGHFEPGPVGHVVVGPAAHFDPSPATKPAPVSSATGLVVANPVTRTTWDQATGILSSVRV